MMKLLIPSLYGLTLVIAALAIAADPAIAQSGIEPVNDLPNPYEATDGHLRMPIGRDWGAVGAIDVDPDGKSIWVAERCGSDSRRCCVRPVSTRMYWGRSSATTRADFWRSSLSSTSPPY